MAAGGAPDTRPGCAAGDERAPVSCRSAAPGRDATRPGSRSPPRGVPRAVRARARARPSWLIGHEEMTHLEELTQESPTACDDAALREDRAGAGARLAQAHPGALGMSRALRRRDALFDEHADGCWHVSPVRAALAGSRHALHRRRVPAGRVVPGAGIRRRHRRAHARAGRQRVTRLGSPRPSRPDRSPRRIHRSSVRTTWPCGGASWPQRSSGTPSRRSLPSLPTKIA